jgi:hypothetical protein
MVIWICFALCSNAAPLLPLPYCLQVGPGVLGYGSGGTVVFSGELDGRPVAVKRMLRQFYEMARKEINALILADEHPNIVRCGWQHEQKGCLWQLG